MSGVRAAGRQLEAVESRDAHTLVIAPPGCGKTELLAMRAEFLVVNGLIRPHRRLLATTYSKRARDNMRQRIQERLGAERAARFVTVANFHGLAGRIVRAHAATIGLRGDFALPTTRWLADTASSLGAGWESRKAAEQRLLEVKSQPISDEEVQDQLNGSGDELALAIERARIESNRLDYQDLIRHAQRLLRVPEVAKLYQQHFDAVLVDEFQDLSVQQFDMLTRVCVRSGTYVGDPLQGIYSWAGAQPDAVTEMLEERCSSSVTLELSYRSSPEVLAMVNAVGVPIGATELKAADPEAWGDGQRTRALRFDDEAAEAEGVSKLVTKLARERPTHSIAVIARSGPRRGLLDAALAKVGDIPIQFWDMALDHPGLLTGLRAAATAISASLPLEEQLYILRERALIAMGGGDDVDTANVVDDAIELLRQRATAGEGVRDILRRTRAVDVADVAPPGVHVLNAHLAKGQQFDWVFVIGLEEGHVPDWRSPEDPEEARILMVMLSRAKRGLIISRSETVKTKFGTVKRPPASRWWSALASAAQSSI
ncbi:UvrD-helicase domain-containing protein [Leifsonia xyli]|uniref:UvrD-helicase domain-containing protein n=1 Tax=Leifsonia xyli TaxID=1575 RepID=UPI003D66F6B7